MSGNPPTEETARRRPERQIKREPRRVRGGLRLRGKDTPNATNWIAHQMQDLIERHWSEAAAADGFFYARRGQIRTLNIEPSGEIVASVQGFPAKPYAVSIKMPTLVADRWDRIVGDMAASAMMAARLLSEELPAEGAMHEVFAAHGQTLLPAADEIGLSCQCVAAKKEPCTHAAAVLYHIVEHLSQMPLLIFTLRGLPSGQLTDRLRHARAMQGGGAASTGSDPLIAQTQQPSPPLDTVLDTFYRAGRTATTVERVPEYQPHALLRRLGPSPLAGRFPITGLLASVYDTVAEGMRRADDPA